MWPCAPRGVKKNKLNNRIWTASLATNIHAIWWLIAKLLIGRLAKQECVLPKGVFSAERREDGSGRGEAE